jgi:MFS transporter, PPP family, 3-phenylpropionic acid transporter
VSDSSSTQDHAVSVPTRTRRSLLRRRPLLALKTSYGFIYAVDGALLPFLSVLLAQQHGLNAYEIGVVLAISGLAAVVGPPLATLLADSFGRVDRLLGLSVLLSGLSLLAFAFAHSYWWVLAIFTVYSLAREPGRPLLDGVYFSARHTEPAVAASSYHKVRIWGSAGFLVPGVLLYFVVGASDDSLASIPFIACGLTLLALLTVPALPVPVSRYVERIPLRQTARAAWQVLSQPSLAVFVLAMFVVQTAFSAYMAFYPFQVTDVVGLEARWLGPLMALGVALEVCYMAAFGWFVRKLGWRWFMVIGVSLQALRSIALAVWPTAAAVIGAQVVHGMIIIVTLVGTRALLDRHATERIRYTVQGFYVMLVFGVSRILGNWLGGALAEVSLTAMFWAIAGCCLAAAATLIWALRNEPAYEETAPAAPAAPAAST